MRYTTGLKAHKWYPAPSKEDHWKNNRALALSLGFDFGKVATKENAFFGGRGASRPFFVNSPIANSLHQLQLSKASQSKNSSSSAGDIPLILCQQCHRCRRLLSCTGTIGTRWRSLTDGPTAKSPPLFCGCHHIEGIFPQKGVDLFRDKIISGIVFTSTLPFTAIISHPIL